MIVNMPFGRGCIEVDVPNCIGICEPPYVKSENDVVKIIKQAVLEPIGTGRLKEIARGKKTTVIIINDVTRPCPTRIMVEEILDELHQGGIKNEDITIVVATGNHRPITEEEFINILGVEIYESIRCINHNILDSDSMAYIGTTSMGVPVYANRIVADADLRITTGLIMPHAGAGFSGGRKSIIPGVSGLETLKIHHSFPIRQMKPAMGWLEGNPFHEQALEGAKMLGVDFIVNTVQNAKNEVIYAVAGDIEKAFYAGVELARTLWEVPIPRKADVVITSPGGYPRDIDLHQSQKAVSCAELAIKVGGIIILTAECEDGIGKFGVWLKEANSPADVIKRFKKQGFTKDSSSKAFMYARAMVDYKLIIVNNKIEKSELESMFFTVAKNINEAIGLALDEKGRGAEFLVMPYGSEIIPIVTETATEMK